MTRDEPIRLEKKESNETIDFICDITKRPEFWLFILIAIIFFLLIIIAFKESGSNLFYNTGINSTI